MRMRTVKTIRYRGQIDSPHSVCEDYWIESKSICPPPQKKMKNENEN